MEHLARLSQLRCVDLSDTLVTDAGLAQLRHLPDLRGLCLNRTAVTDAGLAKLGCLTHLRDLCLVGTNITDVAFSHLLPLQKLRTVNLMNTKVTMAAAQNFRECTLGRKFPCELILGVAFTGSKRCHLETRKRPSILVQGNFDAGWKTDGDFHGRRQKMREDP